MEKIEKDIALKKKRKQEEKEKWWNGADLFRDKIVDNSASNSEAEDLMEIKKQKYTADYSRWEQWVPNDETSIAEVQTDVHIGVYCFCVCSRCFRFLMMCIIETRIDRCRRKGKERRI